LKPHPCRPAARRDEERALFDRLAADRDAHVRDELIERYLPLARSLALRFRHSPEPLEDLIQIASLALVRAIDRFDPSRGYAFAGYAVPTINGALLHHLRDGASVLRLPREMQERISQLDRTTARLAQQLDRTPLISEVAVAMDTSEDRVRDAVRARGARNALSFDGLGGFDHDGTRLEPRVGALDAGYEHAEARAMLDALLVNLTPRAREVLRLRYSHDMTQAQIAAVLGISQMQTSRILRDAIERLRHLARQR
jgi:RNA polymerase sigma-B factor